VTPYYYCAANAIDWSLPTTRIADRKRPLEEKTIRRIKLGLEKFRGQDAYFVQVNKTSDRVSAVSPGVFPTQTGVNGLGLVQPFILNTSHGDSQSGYVYAAQDSPFPAQTCREELAFVTPPFAISLNHDTHNQGTPLLEQALRTQTTYDDTGVVLPPFLVVLRSHSTVASLEDPLQTICAGGEHQALVTPPQPFLIDLIDEYRLRRLTDPLSTVVAGGNHQSIVLPPAWLLSYYNTGSLTPVEGASPTITTVERHALITASASADEISYEECGFRMLHPREIQAAMAFPADYIVTGNRREQVRQLGNACVPPTIEDLTRRAIAALEGGTAA
jgi:DNA (cytosine-5)-methyltransferase 1